MEGNIAFAFAFLSVSYCEPTALQFIWKVLSDIYKAIQVCEIKCRRHEFKTDLPPFFDRYKPSCFTNFRIKPVIFDIPSIYVAAIVYQVFLLFETIRGGVSIEWECKNYNTAIWRGSVNYLKWVKKLYKKWSLQPSGQPLQLPMGKSLHKKLF